MKRMTSLLPVLLFFCMLLPGFANAAKHHIEQPIKLYNSNLPLKTAFNTSVILEIPYNTIYDDWLITISNDENTYEFYSIFTPSSDNYFNLGHVAPGTYTVTLHNRRYAGSNLFDANISFDDENQNDQSEVIYDVNTDNEDIIFHNVIANEAGTGPIYIFAAAHS